jgi:hypothetical protein
LLVPPNPSSLVMFGETVFGVEQNIGIDKNHA